MRFLAVLLVSMKLYQYPQCSTCRQALKFLQANNVEFTSIDITKQPPSKAELNAMLEIYDGDIGKLFNRSGVRYRELKLKDSLPSMSHTDAIDLLANDGKLIKRPFLLGSAGQGIVGFKPDAWQEII